MAKVIVCGTSLVGEDPSTLLKTKKNFIRNHKRCSILQLITTFFDALFFFFGLARECQDMLICKLKSFFSSQCLGFTRPIYQLLIEFSFRFLLFKKTWKKGSKSLCGVRGWKLNEVQCPSFNIYNIFINNLFVGLAGERGKKYRAPQKEAHKSQICNFVKFFSVIPLIILSI